MEYYTVYYSRIAVNKSHIYKSSLGLDLPHINIIYKNSKLIYQHRTVLVLFFLIYIYEYIDLSF